MKKLISLVLIGLFTLVCTVPIAPKLSISEIRKVSTRSIRELPFNPEEILQTWKLLEIFRPKVDIAVVVSGNPKIEWTDEKLKHVFDQPVPLGEVAAAVGITLVIDKRKNVLLMKFVFVNASGIIEFYVHDTPSDTFIRQPHRDQALI